ncbi:MAG: Radical core protein [Pseudomonadota bacterium]|nr:Radical core protein [Pseudomonadota bacterium]
MRVLLITPPLVRQEAYQSDDSRPDFEALRLISPAEPLTVAAILETAGHTVRFVDLGSYANGREAAISRALTDFAPDAVALVQSILTFATSHDWVGKEVFEQVRALRPTAATILTGGHATNYPSKAVGDGVCDYAIKGEVDYALPQLIDALATPAMLLTEALAQIPGLSWRQVDGQTASSEAYPSVDITRLPPPAYHLLSDDDRSRYSQLLEKGKIRYPEKSPRYRDIMTSRGCILRCSFCSVAYLRGEKQRYRRKTIDQVLTEIEQALDDGIEEIHFFDDLFAESEAEILALTDALARRNLRFPWFVAQGMPLWPLTRDALAAMRETGMYRLICPFESGSERVLKRVIGKLADVGHNRRIVEWASALGLEIIGMYVIGMPGETRSELLETLAFAETHPAIDYHVFSIATPMMGTRLTRKLNEQHKLDAQWAEQVNRVVKRTVALFENDETSPVELGLIRSHDWDRINFASAERRQRYAAMVGITLDELEQMRQHSLATFAGFFPDYRGPRSFAELCRSGTASAALHQLAPQLPA